MASMRRIVPCGGGMLAGSAALLVGAGATFCPRTRANDIEAARMVSAGLAVLVVSDAWERPVERRRHEKRQPHRQHDGAERNRDDHRPRRRESGPRGARHGRICRSAITLLTFVGVIEAVSALLTFAEDVEGVDTADAAIVRRMAARTVCWR